MSQPEPGYGTGFDLRRPLRFAAAAVAVAATALAVSGCSGTDVTWDTEKGPPAWAHTR
jgi:hypothetical protein